MKLNKPKVTDNQTELESYVESLLKDNVELVTTADSKVTPLRGKKSLVKGAVLDSHRESLPVSEANSNTRHSIEEPLIHQKDCSKSLESLDPQPSQHKQEGSPIESNENSITDEKQQTKPVGTERKHDVAQQHHEKITKEFKAYQESAHSSIPEPDPRLKNVEKLLNRIALASVVAPEQPAESNVTAESRIATQTEVDTSQQESQAVSTEVAQASFLHRDAKPMKELLGDVFQTLVFEVHKLPLAVPLVKLGGIVNFTEEDVTPLVGTPEWFLGLVPNERGNLMVVDTQKFLMPEKPPSEPIGYEYLIVLDNSNWALACHAVNDAKNLSPDDIRWSARSSKRPWFAGMVVEYMSALVEVDELINMLAENVVE